MLDNWMLHDLITERVGEGETEIYLVCGHAGYSFPREGPPVHRSGSTWSVRGFLVEPEADDFMRLLNDWCVANNTARHSGDVVSGIVQIFPQLLQSGGVQSGGLEVLDYPFQSGALLSPHRDPYSRQKNLKCPYDPKFRWDHGGVEYFIEKVTLKV